MERARQALFRATCMGNVVTGIARAAGSVSIQIDADLGRLDSGRGNQHFIGGIVLGGTDARILIR